MIVAGRVLAQRLARNRRPAEGHEHLADGGAVIVDRAPEPLPGAEEVAAVDLGDVLDAVARRDREVDRLAAGLGQRVERGPGQLDDVALEHAALGHAQDRRAGAQAAALPVLLDQARGARAR